jgi:hypothetical protein
MKNSKFWLAGTLLQFGCAWALAIVSLGLALAQTAGLL